MHKWAHTGKKPYSCDVCQASFAHKSMLRLHKRTHTNKKPFSCEVCASSFTQMLGLHRHIQTHTEVQPFSCEVCGSYFAQKLSFLIHKRTHAIEKPFYQEVCWSYFAWKSGLLICNWIHTGEKPFSCIICGSSSYIEYHTYMSISKHTQESSHFLVKCVDLWQRTSLLIQEWTHNGEKLYACEVGAFSFCMEIKFTRTYVSTLWRKAITC